MSNACSAFLGNYDKRHKKIENTSITIHIETLHFSGNDKTNAPRKIFKWLPVHFFIWLFLFPCDPNLHPKFSSQNSANHTFLRLLARVRLLKYRSNPILKKKVMILIFFHKQILSELLSGYYVILWLLHGEKPPKCVKWGKPKASLMAKAKKNQGTVSPPHHLPFRHLSPGMSVTGKPVVGVTISTSPALLGLPGSGISDLRLNIQNQIRLFSFSPHPLGVSVPGFYASTHLKIYLSYMLHFQLIQLTSQ